MPLSFRTLAAWTVFAFLIALAGTVAFKLLTGDINTRHMLDGRTKDGSRYFSLGRMQLLLFTLWTAANYLHGIATGDSRCTLPDIPPQTLALLGGSHMLYLGGKAYSMFWSKLGRLDK